jgi:hypothetical protein
MFLPLMVTSHAFRLPTERYHAFSLNEGALDFQTVA